MKLTKKEERMLKSLPEATPVLRGKDAERFLKEMLHPKYSAKKAKFLKQCRATAKMYPIKNQWDVKRGYKFKLWKELKIKEKNGIWCIDLYRDKDSMESDRYMAWYLPYELNRESAPLWWSIKAFIWHKILGRYEKLWD